MKILVTGASGFIGGWLVKHLMEEHDLYCPTRKVAALPVHPHVHGIEQDLAARIETSRLPASMDAVIHLAQSRNFRKFPDQAMDIFRVNTDSTVQWLEYGRLANIRVFVLASTGGIYGFQSRPIVEKDLPEPSNFYSASKYSAECLVKAYADHFATVILRYFFVYGEGQREMFMPGLATRVLEGAPVTVSGKTGVTMNPIHVSDAVQATVRALDVQRQETFNIAGEETVTIRDLAEMIGQFAGRAPVYQFESDKGPMAMVASTEKMKLKLGVCPKVLLKEGLDRVVKDLLNGRRGPSS